MLPVIGIENSGVSPLALHVFCCVHPFFSAQTYPIASSGKWFFVVPMMQYFMYSTNTWCSIWNQTWTFRWCKSVSYL